MKNCINMLIDVAQFYVECINAITCITTLQGSSARNNLALSTNYATYSYINCQSSVATSTSC